MSLVDSPLFPPHPKKNFLPPLSAELSPSFFLGIEDQHGLNLSCRRDSEPIRVFFGPPLSPAASDPIKVTLLLVPSLSKNFLISPPGSPPVGWEQILEEAPNTKALHESLVLLDERDGEEKEGWASELDRALRFLSVGVEDEDVVDDTTQRSQPSTTHTIIASERASLRPAVTLSTPSFSFSSPSPFSDATTTPPPGAAKITAVKATIESMLGRKRSYSDFGPAERIELGNIINPPTHLSLSSTIAPRIIPTARPPTESIDEYIES